MGTKVHPRAFRLATIQPPDALWFARGNVFRRSLKEDVLIRAFVLRKLKEAAVDRVVIDRTHQQVSLTIITAKPGVVIGRAGAGIEDLKKQILQSFYRGRRVQMHLNVQEISKVSLSAPVVAQHVAAELEKRMPFRRSMKQAMERVMRAGGLGVRVKVSGRLNGAEIARTEMLAVGKIPLHTLRADIDFSCATAFTLYGTIGVKVWIYRGDIFASPKTSRADQE